jgi:serine racemase
MTTSAIGLQLADIHKAADRIGKFVHRTPVFTCAYLNTLSGGRNLFFKAENLQKTGSFKARGATNAVQSAVEIARRNNETIAGFVTHSSGNHGQALAYAAQCASVKCAVVVPKGTASSKMSAIRSYGAELVLCEPNPQSRDDTCEQISKELGYRVVHPFDDYDVMAGQGTIGLEFIQQCPDLDAVLVPISGGGMTSGIATAIGDRCRVFAVEPLGKELEPSLVAKTRLWTGPAKFLDTVADSLRMQQPGRLTFPILCERAQPVVFSVSNEEMIEGMKLVFERMKVSRHFLSLSLSNPLYF